MNSNPLILDSLSSPLPSVHSRPSIFELLAADELRDLVQPAFRYLLAVSTRSLIGGLPSGDSLF